MTKEELVEALQTAGVREDVYDLAGGHLPETLTLARTQGKWIVYYSERGLETGRREFPTESEACEYFLRVLLNDPTARRLAW